MAHESLRKYLIKNNYDATKILDEADDEEKIEGPDEASLEREIDHKGDRWEEMKGKKGRTARY